MTVEIFTAMPSEAVGLDHFGCCCDFKTAFCGTDITAAEWTVDDEKWRLCIVCVDLYEHYQKISVCCPKDPAVRHG